jgi:lantibiotic modifying enzyme
MFNHEKYIDYLRDTAVGNSNQITWLSAESIIGDLKGISPAPANLYFGGLGIALYLALYEAHAGSTKARLLKEAYLRSVLADIKNDFAEQFRSTTTPGLGSGIGSLLYGVAYISRLRSSAEAEEIHQRVLARFDDLQIESCMHVDVIDGLSGLGLGLLRAAETFQDKRALMLAEKCGEAILKKRKKKKETGFSGDVRPLLTGLSHGSDGIALFLRELSVAIDSNRYDDAIISLETYTAQTYSSEYTNFFDLRFEPEETQGWQQNRWCHGATGIGIAHLRSVRSTQEKTLIEPFAFAALDNILNFGFSTVNDLCCGVLGQIDYLNEVANIEGISRGWIKSEHDVKGYAQQEYIHRARRVLETPNQFSLSLFKGLSGFAYVDLRLRQNNIPSVLAFE